jgi:5-methylcytosine-specific restriction endonuclease McrA
MCAYCNPIPKPKSGKSKSKPPQRSLNKKPTQKKSKKNKVTLTELVHTVQVVTLSDLVAPVEKQIAEKQKKESKLVQKTPIPQKSKHNSPTRNVIPESQQRKNAPYCERCGKWGQTERHHIKKRSHGGGDEPENTIDLCHKCHTKTEIGELTQEECYTIVAAREEYKSEHGAFPWEIAEETFGA